MILSLLQAFIPYFSALPLYVTFPAIAGAVLILTLAATLLTEPTDRATLIRFYSQVRPAGFWGPVAAAAASTATVAASFRRDALNVGLAIPWLIAMYLSPIYLVLHRFAEAGTALAAVILLSLALYLTWYKHLPED
jgi:hypothetical protein